MSGLFIVEKDLYTPGPTMTPKFVKDAYLRTDIYHRSPEFEKIFLNCSNHLKPFFGTVQSPLILSSSGTGAMEAAVVNLTDVKDKVLVISAGKFGERWRKLCEAYQCNVLEYQLDVSDQFNEESFKQFIKPHKGTLHAIFVQAHETSVGALLPVEQISKLVKAENPEALIVVDAISCLGAHKVDMDHNKFDCVVSGSQKGFGVGPGLSFIALSQFAWERISTRPKFYFDLNKEKKGQATGRAAYTPAIPLVLGLEAALIAIHNQGGVDQFIRHHESLGRATRSAVKAMGLEFFVHESMRSNVLTNIKVPNELDGLKVLATAKSKYGAIISGGQDELKGKIIRFGHLGFMNQFHLLRGVSALEFALIDEGWSCSLGEGVKAAMGCF